MKITLEKKDKDYLYLAIILLIVGLSITYQVKSARGYNTNIDSIGKLNSKQKKDIGSLKASVGLLNDKTKKLTIQADSLRASEEKYKLNYHAANKKYKDALSSYNNSSDDAKWRLLTEVINE